MTGRRREEGVTLIEMTVTLACFFLVLGVAVQLYVAGMRAWQQGAGQALDQAGSRWVLSELASLIRAGRELDLTRLEENDAVLWMQTQDGRWMRMERDPVRRAVRIEVGQGDPDHFAPAERRWLGSRVGDLRFEPRGSGVAVQLRMEGSEPSEPAEVVTAPRVNR
ncbi:MAG: hypothetical protein QJR06_07950 [Alicyclobacillaceae bacterium]|nr:hypothetical protein [Alicyclobacillaceae bacterium]